MINSKFLLFFWLGTCLMMTPFCSTAQNKTCPLSTYEKSIVKNNDDTYTLQVNAKSEAYFVFMKGKNKLLNYNSADNAVTVKEKGVYTCRMMMTQGCKATIVFDLNKLNR